MPKNLNMLEREINSLKSRLDVFEKAMVNLHKNQQGMVLMLTALSGDKKPKQEEKKDAGTKLKP